MGETIVITGVVTCGLAIGGHGFGSPWFYVGLIGITIMNIGYSLQGC